MSKLIRVAITIALLLLVSACSTVHFHNGDQLMSQEQEYSQWHHAAIFGLVEVSQPVDMSRRCPGVDWTRITTQLTFLGGLADLVTYGLWTPWSVSYSCDD